MTYAPTRSDLHLGSVSILGATGAIDNNNQSGLVSASVRNGAGDYTLTLAPGIDAQQAAFQATARGAALNTNITVNPISVTSIQVLTAVAAAATDVNFDLSIWRTRTEN